MGSARPRAVVLDAGALIAFERNDRRVRRLIELATERGGAVHIPAGVLAQVWRDGRRQARLAGLLRSGLPQVQSLDFDQARAAGALCGATSTSDVIDASVALLARRHQAVVVTSDPDDIGRLDARLVLLRC